MKIVVLAQASETTWMMVNALRSTYPDIEVLLEQPVSRLALLRRRAKRIGFLSVFGQVMFILMAPILCRSAPSRREELIRQAGLSAEKPSDINVQECTSVNSSECIAWIATRNPDVVVVNGTRIISADVLGSSNAVFLNTHCGITPAYRGVHGGYWALYQGHPERMGVTVHVVSTGIDTGDIVYQEAASVDSQDSFLTYPIKQYIAGIPLMLKAIDDVARNRLRTFVRKDLPSSLWHHPTLLQYVGARWSRGVR
jgi:folate-dependent phosphoribosylglycinamide formyltransferase PurN